MSMSGRHEKNVFFFVPKDEKIYLTITITTTAIAKRNVIRHLIHNQV